MRSQTKQNQYFDANEYGAGAAKGGEGAAQRFKKATQGLFIFGLLERNKITQVLLR